MCNVNHPAVTPGYLIAARVESFAPPAILTRTLANHGELGLTNAQIESLLELARGYSTRYLEVATRFANLTAQLDIVEARPDFDLKRRLIAEHAQIFQEHELLLVEAAEQFATILDEQQLQANAQLYERDKAAMLANLAAGLQLAMAQRPETPETED